MSLGCYYPKGRNGSWGNRPGISRTFVPKSHEKYLGACPCQLDRSIIHIQLKIYHGVAHRLVGIVAAGALLIFWYKMSLGASYLADNKTRSGEWSQRQRTTAGIPVHCTCATGWGYLRFTLSPTIGLFPWAIANIIFPRLVYAHRHLNISKFVFQYFY